MLNVDETLDRISRSGQAVFATDGADRIVLWNKACEALLGKAARNVLGKRCYEVMCGRDSNGNLYCHRACPVAYQAREMKEQPVKPFELSVKTGDGKERKLSSALFAIPDYHPALTKLVHVLRPAVDRVEIEASEPRPESPEALTPAANATGESAALTVREKEILRCLVRGLATAAIAKQARHRARDRPQSRAEHLAEAGRSLEARGRRPRPQASARLAPSAVDVRPKAARDARDNRPVPRDSRLPPGTIRPGCGRCHDRTAGDPGRRNQGGRVRSAVPRQLADRESPIPPGSRNRATRRVRPRGSGRPRRNPPPGVRGLRNAAEARCGRRCGCLPHGGPCGQPRRLRRAVPADGVLRGRAVRRRLRSHRGQGRTR